jgi:hypothetical protein
MTAWDEDRQWVEIDYTNWRGERRSRTILPRRLDFTATEWHPAEQWILWAQDGKDGAVKAFALSGVHGWKPAA